MKKSAKLREQISALKTELTQARTAEKQATSIRARRALLRAVRQSGLLALVIAGTLTDEALSAEFHAMAVRAAETTTETPSGVDSMPPNTNSGAVHPLLGSSKHGPGSD